jgi:hypothetical protein
LMSLVLVKAILPFSPGKVANADWFGNISGSTAMKMLDRIIIILLTIITLPNSRKPRALAIVVTSFNGANNRDDILILRKECKEYR